jgi:hypothetical protein
MPNMTIRPSRLFIRRQQAAAMSLLALYTALNLFFDFLIDSPFNSYKLQCLLIGRSCKNFSVKGRSWSYYNDYWQGPLHDPASGESGTGFGA